MGCPGNQDLQFVYGVAAPSGTPKATIVFLAGDGGVVAADGPEEQVLLARYVNDGYQVVQIAWGPHQEGQDWEITNVANAPSILVGACRPATFLNWVRNGNSGVGNGIWAGNGGMCAEGHSAGSGAIAYALTWYNAGAASAATNGQGYLDKVILDSGPVFSDIRQGCEVPNNQYTTICNSPGQTGCEGWSDPAPASLEFTNGYNAEVNTWSGNTTSPSCANNTTPTTYNTQWFNMSILAPAQGGQTPSFNYTKTTMSAYLCASGAPGVITNNVAAQGQLYYAQFTNQSQAGESLGVWAVSGCPSTEGIYGTGSTVVSTGIAASDAIFTDMTTSCKPNHGTQ